MRAMTSDRDRGEARMPAATAHEARLRLFQATRRPREIEHVQETAWGRVRIKGRLGQQHADVLEAIRYCAEAQATDGAGRMKLLVDPARVRRMTRQDGSTLRQVLDDLMSCVIEIIEPDHLAAAGHLIDTIDKARRGDDTLVTRHNPLDGGQRPLWRVVVGDVGMRLLMADLRLDRSPRPLAAMDHGVTAAIVRHVLTHRAEPAGGWTLDGLIRAVCGGIGDQALRDRRREVRADAGALAVLGLRIDGDRVRRVEHTRGSVEQTRDAVEHTRGSVEHTRDFDGPCKDFKAHKAFKALDRSPPLVGGSGPQSKSKEEESARPRGGARRTRHHDHDRQNLATTNTEPREKQVRHEEE